MSKNLNYDLCVDNIYADENAICKITATETISCRK